MSVIYKTRGRAKEYTPLALETYTGCSHGCRYCYAPQFTRTNRQTFLEPEPRPDVLRKLEKDIKRLKGDPRPILLCFTCDPYQPLEAEHRLTRGALERLGDAGLNIRILTKNGRLALRDLDLFERYQVEVGVSLCWYDDERRQEWEPHAGSVQERIELLKQARERALDTWVSVEPVIDPWQAIGIIDQLQQEDSLVTTWKVGKLNHHPEIEDKVDWHGVLLEVLDALYYEQCANYLIKDDLWKFADADTRRRWPRYCGIAAYDIPPGDQKPCCIAALEKALQIMAHAESPRGPKERLRNIRNIRGIPNNPCAGERGQAP